MRRSRRADVIAGHIGAVRAQGVHVTALYTLTSSWAQDGQVGGIFSMDCFPVLLRLKPLCFAQEVLEQPALFSADALLEWARASSTVRGLSNSLGWPSSTR
jgi:hypothetical protein